MANFKSKDLTISIPEKGAAEPAGTACTCNTNIQQTKAGGIHPTTTIWTCVHFTNPCLGFTPCGFSPVTCHINTLCHGYSPIISPGTCTTSYHYTPTACTTTNPCTASYTDPVFTTEYVENEISGVTDIETLNTLKEKLAAALKEVQAQHDAIAKK
jgi:hypothetical protein